ncbi:MAG: thioredoxin [Pseudomonadota bacterium]
MLNTQSAENWVFDATAENFESMVVNAEVPVLVDFWAPWCGPCQQITPMLNNLADRYQGRFKVAKVNVDEENALAGAFGVRSIPMLVLFHQKLAVEQIVGLQPEQALVQLIDKYVAPADDDSRKAAQNAVLNADDASAREVLLEALRTDPENGAVKVDLARAEMALGQYDAALGRLTDLPDEIESSSDVRTLIAELGLLAEASRLESSDSPLARALAEAARKNYAVAIDALLEIVRTKDADESGAAKANLFRIFDLLGSADNRVQTGRRALANLLN